MNRIHRLSRPAWREFFSTWTAWTILFATILPFCCYKCESGQAATIAASSSGCCVSSENKSFCCSPPSAGSSELTSSCCLAGCQCDRCVCTTCCDFRCCDIVDFFFDEPASSRIDWQSFGSLEAADPYPVYDLRPYSVSDTASKPDVFKYRTHLLLSIWLN